MMLLVCSGFISASEVAYFSLEPNDIDAFRQEETKRSKAILKLTDSRKKLLACILISNNLVNIFIVVLSSLWLNSAIDFTAKSFTILGLYIQSAWIDFSIKVGLVTFLLLLFGEIIPKILATQKKLEIVKMMALPLQFLNVSFTGLINILTGFSSFIDKKIKVPDQNLTVDQLTKAYELTNEEESSESEQKILEGIVKFGNTSAKQAMTSRIDIVAIDENAEFNFVITEILKSGYSRIPVYRDNLDQIVGVIYIKDLLPHLEETSYNWKALMRAPYFIPESKKIDDLLKEFQNKKIHLAVVVDEYGGTSGIISLEDILEEIVGDIQDEFDEEEVFYSKLDENQYIFEGKTPLIDFYRIIDVDEELFEENKGDSESLAGFIIEICGKIPLKNEKINFDRYTFIIEAADKRRLKQIKLIINEVQNEEIDEE